MLVSEYDREGDQVRLADDFGQMVVLSSEQAIALFRWLSHLFSQCQGCDQLVSSESIQALTYLREVAPFRAQTAWLCPDCYAEMSVHTSKQKNAADQTLFINLFGVPLTINGIEQLLQEAAKRAGVTGVRVSPHTFRHTFARMFLENGGDVYKLSLLLEHSSVVVTENYLKDFESRNARNEQIKHSPVANMT